MKKKMNVLRINQMREERRINNNQTLLKASKMNVEELLNNYSTSFIGLNEVEVEEKKKKYGKNIITSAKKDSKLKKIFFAFISPFTIVLFILAIISYVTDYLISNPNERNLTTVIIILVMVSISGVLKFSQENKLNNASEKLKEMINITTTVIRDKVSLEIELNDLVVGDIVHLSAGDMIPADLRIIQAKDLFVSQSALTGESKSIEKFVKDENAKIPLEANNLVFMGSNVISGSAYAMVVCIGDDTFFGSLAISDQKVTTSFEKGISEVSWVLIKFMSVMVPIVFVINGLTKGNWLEAFLFGLSIAVGLTPEMLPMIVTTNLAKGSLKMAKEKTIIKNINSIQDFGAMDILCTDKTGTLTEDKIVLEMYLNIHGEDDKRVLRHGFLNSYYQTGLKNQMDVAILEHTSEFLHLINKYKKVDEIPFDFTRRRMSVVIQDKSQKTQLITKGAVEEMIKISSFVEKNGEVFPLTNQLKSEILNTVNKLNDKGLRVIAVSQKNNIPSEGIFSISDESEMVLIGFLAFLDPPKESAKAAIKALKDYGVGVKVLTGDNDGVTLYVSQKVGIKANEILLGSQIEIMSDDELIKVIDKIDIYAKLSPLQKARIIRLLRQKGHVVGYLGDGINDTLAMQEADVSISVDTAVDIAKESADIILLEKDLMVLEKAVIEGRKTFANIIKYIKMTASSNFGNMLSVLVASAFLPFLPMLSIQLIFLNLIYDISCVSIPWDNVDDEFLNNPRKWDASSISKFMFWIGPTSSVFDIITYVVMYFIICPLVVGGSYNDPSVNKILFIAVFNAGWFIESLWSQTLVIHMIRSPKLPFIQSRASLAVIITTITALTIGTIIPFSPIAKFLKFTSLPPVYFVWLLLIIFGYMTFVTILKKMFVKKYKSLL